MIILPIADDAPQYRQPWVVFGLIAVNVLVHIYAMTLSVYELEELRLSYGSLGTASDPDGGFTYSVFRSISCGFLHGDLMHLAGNMWFLYLFGRTVEGKLGPVRMASAYVAYLILSDLAHYLLAPSGYIVAIGASGAVSGIIGTYWFLFPRYQITFFYFVMIFIRFWTGVKSFAVHWAVAYWFGWDLLKWYLAHQDGGGSGVAHSAHLGGLAAGVFGALLMRKLYLVKLDGEDMLSLWLTRDARRKRRRGISDDDDDWAPPQIAPQDDAAGSSHPGARPAPGDDPIPFDPDD